jgi:hypothetical protein
LRTLESAAAWTLESRKSVPLHFHSFVDDTCAPGFRAEALSVALGTVRCFGRRTGGNKGSSE